MALLAPWFFSTAQAQAQASVTPAEARAIAKEAYIYGFPMVDHYRIQYSYFQDNNDPNYKTPWNHLINIPRVYTPEDTAIQTPNSDTPYSFIGMDLRTEPMVITVPKIDKERYFSVQLVDTYTHNFAYIGSRTTGNDGGSYLIAGPNWKGKTPKGIKTVIQSETEFVFGAFRTQLFNPADLENVKKVQAGYKAQPLSAFLGKPAPKAAPAIDFIKPLTPETQRTSPEFYGVLDFVLQFCPTVPSEKELMARFAKIGVGAGKTFDASKLSPEMGTAIEQGMADALAELAALQERIDAKEVTSGEMFGTREYLKNNYLYRMAAAVNGIYGNSQDEAIYPLLALDSEGQKLDGSQRYTLRFAPGQLPPVNAFWSMTMYRMPEILLVDNPIDRYLLNSPMLDQFKRDADGGLTLYFQNESPGKDKESNWLPAPKGWFMVVMRLYWPKEEALSGKWSAPQLKRAQ
ncbi:MAG: cell envelope protein [Gammaproteobacteria bacterium SG8_47]|nr:MAG: cell envelope protein [Gammaproteobacteria bacterium SG8_47]